VASSTVDESCFAEHDLTADYTGALTNTSRRSKNLCAALTLCISVRRPVKSVHMMYDIIEHPIAW